MASIFLSYSREDASKAEALAKSLERAGHSVWWDRHIHGGREYAGEIEAVLRVADVVLVLWSCTAVRSAWVRDEAAEGRDSGRLVPVVLDECTPPPGFRQIQSIALTGWSGRGDPANLQDILVARPVGAGIGQSSARNGRASLETAKDCSRQRCSGGRSAFASGWLGVTRSLMQLFTWEGRTESPALYLCPQTVEADIRSRSGG